MTLQDNCQQLVILLVHWLTKDLFYIYKDAQLCGALENISCYVADVTNMWLCTIFHASSDPPSAAKQHGTIHINCI